MRTAFVLLLLATLLVAPATAQTVRGVVVEDDTSLPVDGAMVILFDARGEAVDRVLTDGLGRYALDAKAPGAHSIRVDRIGYESVSTGTFQLGAEGLTRDLSIPVRAIELEGLDVSGSRRCEVRPEEGQATARIWGEARKALEATAWTLNQGVYRYTLLRFSRDLDANGHLVLEESREFYRGRSQAPYISLPAEELVKNGFVHTLPDGRFSYYAPDADVLLSDAFLDTHCMKLRDGKDGLLGVELEPVAGRRLPDIEGTLWLDRTTAQLKRLDFRYVNLEGSPRVNGEPGGEVVFGGLPNGTWVVREWRIRMPLIDRREGSQQLYRLGYRDEGSVVWRVIDRDGTTLLEATTATVTGLVHDSTGVGAVPGVTVSTATGEEAKTNEDGSFLLSGLAEGMHPLSLRHPSLDSLGLAAPAAVVMAELGDVANARIMLPSPGQVLIQACGGDPRPTATGILFGRLVDESGGRVPGAKVRLVPLAELQEDYSVADIAAPERPGDEPLKWSAVRVGRLNGLEATLDERGIFVLCDVPTPAQVRILVGEAGSELARKTVTIREGETVEIVTMIVPVGGAG